MQPTAQSPSPAEYRHVLVAVDSSPHSEAATAEAVSLARAFGADVTGMHAYAARLHDTRFRQMEGVLPARYQIEPELERQRGIHETLIERGLDLVSDSYLDQTEKACAAGGVPFRRVGREGKNYRVLLAEARAGAHDLLVLGFQGLGATRDDVPGTVCLRVVRRTPVDTLVVKTREPRIGSGPIVVGIDGSAGSFGALLRALSIGRRLGVPVHAVAVFDPHFHVVAFDRIKQVLSDEAGRVFKVEEQEKLHGELIDAGLAKIYQANLHIAERVAEDHGAKIETFLVPGKPWQAVVDHCIDVGASLLVVGKLGVHADPELDLGGTTELLLLHAPPSLLVVTTGHEPDVEVVARETVTWSPEAEARLLRAPEIVRPMIKRAVLMWASQRGHTVVTSEVMDAATRALKPGGGGPPGGEGGSP